ncbi:hypothetical protein [Streptosporangium sp. NPDC051022]|uniref:hypothetical protein n=1 Tax=Streptosporangium sp. NPDC051022 TaxID=3155752 RepID=UPI00343AADB8
MAIVIALLVISAALWGACKGTKAAVGITAGAFRRHVAPRPAEDILTIVAASIATGVSAQGMWRFTGDVLGFDGPLQLLLFAFIEVAVITSAVRARRNMRENFSAGIDGAAVWALTVLTAVLSAMDAHSLAEAIFRLAAPLVAAWLWERGMAVERHRITGRKRINWVITPEKILIRLGLAEGKERSASEVATQRLLTRAALAAKRARTLRESGASASKMRRALTKLDDAIKKATEQAGLAANTSLQERLRDEVAALYSSVDLLDVAPASAWASTSEEPSDFARLAKETQNLNESLAIREELRAIEANVTMLAADMTGKRPASMTPGMTLPVTADEVTASVTPDVTDEVVIVPPEWTGEAADVTPGVTPDVTSGPVINLVNFDINDPAIFDLEWPPPPLADMTPELTPVVTAEDVNDEVTEQSKADIMRAFWDGERAQGRYPRVVDLANAADADPAQASRLRAELVKALPWRERSKATFKKVTAVNGSTPSS